MEWIVADPAKWIVANQIRIREPLPVHTVAYQIRIRKPLPVHTVAHPWISAYLNKYLFFLIFV